MITENKSPRILVIGSFMMDLVVRTDKVPEMGETVIGKSFGRFPGGKGANQAVAAARLGAQVTMAGKLGQDVFGDQMLAALQAEGVNTDHILRDEEAPTGVGSITLDKTGNNRIIVVPGANLRYNREDLSQIESIIQASDILMLQLEIDLQVVEAAAELAVKHNVPVILNPAPAQSLSDKLLQSVTYLTPNETEAEILTGIKVATVDDGKKAADLLLAKGVGTVVITLGDKGALAASKQIVEHIPGFTVDPVDTVAAGDAFNGALAVAVAQGFKLTEAVRYANAVGAIAVTRAGAIPSLPTQDEVAQFLASQSDK